MGNIQTQLGESLHATAQRLRDLLVKDHRALEAVRYIPIPLDMTTPFWLAISDLRECYYVEFNIVRCTAPPSAEMLSSCGASLDFAIYLGELLPKRICCTRSSQRQESGTRTELLYIYLTSPEMALCILLQQESPFRGRYKMKWEVQMIYRGSSTGLSSLESCNITFVLATWS